MRIGPPEGLGRLQKALENFRQVGAGALDLAVDLVEAPSAPRPGRRRFFMEVV